MTTEAKLTYEELQKNFESFYGTQGYYRLGLVPIVATDGVKYFADTCECYWLLDDIAINLYRKHKELGSLFIDIDVNKRHTVHITVRQDEGMPIVYDKKIRDLCGIIPSGHYSIWLMDNVLLLPNEY